MRKLKPIVATTPEELAGALGLSGVAAKDNGAKAPVPRHAEIDNRLAHKIRPRLAIIPTR
jgi:hypothetical protein